MQLSIRRALKRYGLRITSFVCTMAFTFIFPELLLALLSWVVLGGLFWQDFFPATWPWEFE